MLQGGRCRSKLGTLLLLLLLLLMLPLTWLRGAVPGWREGQQAS